MSVMTAYQLKTNILWNYRFAAACNFVAWERRTVVLFPQKKPHLEVLESQAAGVSLAALTVGSQ